MVAGELVVGMGGVVLEAEWSAALLYMERGGWGWPAYFEAAFFLAFAKMPSIAPWVIGW